MAFRPLSEEVDGIRRKLFTKAMRSEWEEVFKIYKGDKTAYCKKITKAGDTALHIAVSDGQKAIVKRLVDLMRTTDEKEAELALAVKNEQGNTPLHLAASMGNVEMCHCIASFRKPLIGERNNDNETPFFSAVLNGKKDAFLCLNSICGNVDGLSYCRRKEGETILHVAIAAEYFDLAFQIIHLYDKDLVNSVNEYGVTPLHILASKPSAFRSGSHISRYNKIIYHCTFVDELKDPPETKKGQSDLDPPETKKGQSDLHPPETEASEHTNKCCYPKKCQTCNSFLWLRKKAIDLVMKPCNGTKKVPGDAENQKEEGQSEDKNYPENYQTCISFLSLPKNAIDLVMKLCNGTKKCPAGDAQNREGNQPANRFNGHLIPSNYITCFDFVKLVCKIMLVILGLGSMDIERIREKKEKHTWSIQIMKELLERSCMYEFENAGGSPQPRTTDEAGPYEIADSGDVTFLSEIEKQMAVANDKILGNKGEEEKTKTIGVEEKTPILIAQKKDVADIVGKIRDFFQVGDKNLDKNHIMLMAMEKTKIQQMPKKETAILIAAKNGIAEMVESILDKYPVAIHDMDAENKNIVLLAVEHRQPHVYQLLLKRKTTKDGIFRKADNKGNSALHLAAGLGEHKPWLIPGAALQMQWEIKWYEFVKSSMPHHFFIRYNKDGKTPRDIFSDTHQDLVKSGGEWLTNTSESCSVVAALIATVAFATSATVPGGVSENNGAPILENQPAFNIFAISSLISLCFSVTAVVMFLSILTSRYQEKDFGKDLPKKLLVGLTSLFISIASVLVCFCAGHFFVLKDQLKYAAFPIYAATCLPVTFFAVAQFPLYFDLVWAAFKKVPQRSYIAVPL